MVCSFTFFFNSSLILSTYWRALSVSDSLDSSFLIDRILGWIEFYIDDCKDWGLLTLFFALFIRPSKKFDPLFVLGDNDFYPRFNFMCFIDIICFFISYILLIGVQS